MEEKIRINKYLALSGVASRRKCEDIILSGKVKVNGVVVKDLATYINCDKDLVTVNEKTIKKQEEKVYYLLNKPEGVISASNSKYKEKTVVDLIDDDNHRLFPVGRLDKDTTGVILITNDGDFAYKLTHPKFEKEKTYEALVKGKVEGKDIRKLEKGVVVDGKVTAGSKARLVKIVNSKNSIIEITLIEGRNRQVKKMCKCIGHEVLKLKRIKEGSIELGNLKEGEYRPLKKSEIRDLMR